ERLLQQGRREGVVADGENPALTGRRGEGREGGHLERRVRGGLEPDQVGPVDGGEDGWGVGDLDVADGVTLGRVVGEQGRGDGGCVARCHGRSAGGGARPRRA